LWRKLFASATHREKINMPQNDTTDSSAELDLAGVMRRLVEATEMEGGIRPWAKARGLHASIIDHFLRGQRGPSPQLLEALGLRKVTRYQVEDAVMTTDTGATKTGSTDDWTWRRFGRQHDKPCKRPNILTCAMWECQQADECRWDEQQGRRVRKP
jgi:hypothetical protein